MIQNSSFEKMGLNYQIMKKNLLNFRYLDIKLKFQHVTIET
jgi:hypothetical protein